MCKGILLTEYLKNQSHAVVKFETYISGISWNSRVLIDLFQHWLIGLNDQICNLRAIITDRCPLPTYADFASECYKGQLKVKPRKIC